MFSLAYSESQLKKTTYKQIDRQTLETYIYTYLTVYQSIFLSVYLPTYLCICLSVKQLIKIPLPETVLNVFF